MHPRILAPLAVAAILTAPLPGPAVGTMAPDFVLPTVTRYGKLASPTRLTDLKGQTVVIAFFYKARTKG
jgi:thioredoxin-dependent peroxiredoxin